MDNEEKRVLKRKRHTIAKNLVLTPECIEDFRHSNLLTDHTYDVIMAESTNFQKVIKLMELIPPLNDPQTLAKLCSILERDYEWLADEIRAELMAERGQLKIDDYIVKESAQLVFREFGSSKRLSEREKKDIQTLVAVRTQYAKEVWRRRLDLVREELTSLREANAQKDAMASQLTDAVHGFVKVHASRLRKEFHNGGAAARSKSTSQALRENGPSENSFLDQLEDAIRELEAMTSQSLLEKDSLCEERMRALKVLDIKDVNAQIEVELRKKIEESLQKLREREKEAEENSQRANALRAELEEMKRQSKLDLLSKDQTMEQLASHLNHAHQRVRNMQEDLERLRHELVVTQRDCARYRERAEKLERARRLGYIHESFKIPVEQVSGGSTDRQVKPRITAKFSSPGANSRPASRATARSERSLKAK